MFGKTFDVLIYVFLFSTIGFVINFEVNWLDFAALFGPQIQEYQLDADLCNLDEAQEAYANEEAHSSANVSQKIEKAEGLYFVHHFIAQVHIVDDQFQQVLVQGLIGRKAQALGELSGVHLARVAGETSRQFEIVLIACYATHVLTHPNRTSGIEIRIES